MGKLIETTCSTVIMDTVECDGVRISDAEVVGQTGGCDRTTSGRNVLQTVQDDPQVVPMADDGNRNHRL